MTAIVSELNITLAGNSVDLKVSPRAAKEVTAYFGNYMEAFQKLAQFDHDAYVAIVAAGAGKKRTDISDDVFRTGLDTLTSPLSEFVGLLSRGGRPAESDDAEGDKTGKP